MTFPIRPAASPTLHPIVGPDEVGPRNEDEQYIHAMVIEAIESPPPVLTHIDALEMEMRAFIRQCRKPA